VNSDPQVAPVRLGDDGRDLLLASICDSPERLSAILMKLTPCLPCRRTSVTISSAVLQSLPMEWSGVPSHDGSSSSMQP